MWFFSAFLLGTGRSRKKRATARVAPTGNPEQRRRGRRPRRPVLDAVGNRNCGRRAGKPRPYRPVMGCASVKQKNALVVRVKAPPLGELSSEARLKGSTPQRNRVMPEDGVILHFRRLPPFASLRSAPPPEGEAMGYAGPCWTRPEAGRSAVFCFRSCTKGQKRI